VLNFAKPLVYKKTDDFIYLTDIQLKQFGLEELSNPEPTEESLERADPSEGETEEAIENGDENDNSSDRRVLSERQRRRLAKRQLKTGTTKVTFDEMYRA